MIKQIVAAIISVLRVAFPRGVCRFQPSCSEYALEALERHPVPRAAHLIAGRLLRCHPLCRGGFDPVPETLKTEGNSE